MSGVKAIINKDGKLISEIELLKLICEKLGIVLKDVSYSEV